MGLFGGLLCGPGPVVEPSHGVLVVGVDVGCGADGVDEPAGPVGELAQRGETLAGAGRAEAVGVGGQVDRVDVAHPTGGVLGGDLGADLVTGEAAGPGLDRGAGLPAKLWVTRNQGLQHWVVG